MKKFVVFTAAVLFCGVALYAQDAMPWMIGPFTRPASGNPVIAPLAASTFIDPISKAPVQWEALHTFNPAAIVRNGKIDVLYRAEDNSGAMEIGGHTSRLGLAESTDGIHFTRLAAPVFYPADDDQKEREWPGGVEDPRIVEREDGTYVLTYTQWNRQTYSVGIATSRDLTALDEVRAGVPDCGRRKICSSEVQVGRHRDARGERPPDRGTHQRDVLDVLGRGLDSHRDVAGLDSLGAGRGSKWRACRAAAATAEFL